jgi:hypothetical protein
MKQLILVCTISIMGVASHGQRNELRVYPNGLIYSDSTIGRLKFIVDSLQLRFRHCDLTRDYFSVRQGKGQAIILNIGNIRAAFADIQRGIDYGDFIKKYPLAKADPSVAFYLPEALSSRKLPAVYARLLLYADCMTDTSAIAGWPP